jgi:hypothetical protein
MTNPLVTPETYIRAETDRAFYNASQLTGGVNSMFSFRNVTPLDRQTVVRMKKDGSYTIRFNSPGERKPLPGPFFFRSLSCLPAFGPIFLLDKVFFFN